jgi:hypothetical protein
MIIRNSTASEVNSAAQVIQASYLLRQHEALRGGGGINADDAVNAHRKFNPLDNLAVK